MTWLLVIVGILANAAASVLVKLSSKEPLNLADPVGLLTNWRLLLAAVSYGVAFLAYAAAVTRLPLNIAHPISTAGAIVIVGAASAFLIRDAFTPLHWLGYGLLLAGIVALAFAKGAA
jgi:multidrug transporter EmrE-like cation transporter